MGRIILILLAIFVLAPIGLTILFSGISIGVGAVVMTYMFGMVTGGEPVAHNPEWNVVNVSPGSGYAKSYSSLVKRGEIHSERTARIKAIMSFENIRGNDKTAVDPADRATYAKLAGPRLARAECDLLQVALASKCVVGSVQVEHINNVRNIFLVDMELLYVEKAEMGTVKPGIELSFVETTSPLRRNGVIRQRIDRLGQQDIRTDFYRDAVSLCQRQRTQLGNCSIQDVRVNLRYDGNADMVELEGYVDVALLQPQANAKQVENQLRR